MSDTTRGLYGKFEVKRTDGSSGPGGKHERCNYFVLDLVHDPFAIPALRAYAEACRGTHPALADHLGELVSDSSPSDAFSEIARPAPQDAKEGGRG